MWKCPQCETLNKDEKCVICGEANPYFPRVSLNSDRVGQGKSKLRSTMRKRDNSQSNIEKSDGLSDAYMAAEAFEENDRNREHDSSYFMQSFSDIYRFEAPKPEVEKRNTAVIEPQKNIEHTMIYENSGSIADDTETFPVVPAYPITEDEYSVPDFEDYTDDTDKKSGGWMIVWVTAVILIICISLVAVFGIFEFRRLKARGAFGAEPLTPYNDNGVIDETF